MLHHLFERNQRPRFRPFSLLVAGVLAFLAFKGYEMWAQWPRPLNDPANFRDCDECPEMVRIPPGSYMRGSPETDVGRKSHEGPVKKVTIRYSFAVSAFEITEAQWKAIMGGGIGYNYGPDAPISSMSWLSAKEFVRRLSDKTGKQYRLLSESEWEYVARAGSKGPFHFGQISAEKANYRSEMDPYLGSAVSRRIIDEYFAEGDTYPPNAFGLYNVHGNVAEWVEDCYFRSYQNVPTDGRAINSPTCKWRVLRGGSASNRAAQVRSAARDPAPYNQTVSNAGIRVARELD